MSLTVSAAQQEGMYSPNSPLPTADGIRRSVTNNARRIPHGPNPDLQKYLTMDEKASLYGSRKPGAVVGPLRAGWRSKWLMPCPLVPIPRIAWSK